MKIQIQFIFDYLANEKNQKLTKLHITRNSYGPTEFNFYIRAYMFHADLQKWIQINVQPNCPTTISIKQAVTKCCDLIQKNPPNFPYIRKTEHRQELLDEIQYTCDEILDHDAFKVRQEQTRKRGYVRRRR